MAVHATLSVWTAGLGVHTHPVPSCSNLHKWWLSQIEWPGCQSLISLTEDWWPIYFFITSHYALGTLFFIIFFYPTVLSISFPLFFHIFFLALLPSFSANLSFPPLLWETWFAESDWVCQSDIASLITEAQSPSEGHINRWGAMVHTRLRESVPVSSPHLPFTQNVCVFNTTLIPSKTHNLRHHQKRMHFILNLSYSNKITSRTFQLEMTVFFLNASLPLATNTWPSIIWRLPHEMWALLINFIIAHWHFSDVFLITLIDSFE